MHCYFNIPIIGSAVPMASFPFTELLSRFYLEEYTSLRTVLSSHGDVFPLVQAQVCPEASA